MTPLCTRMCPYPFFEVTTPGAAPGPPVKTGARVRRIHGCNYALAPGTRLLTAYLHALILEIGKLKCIVDGAVDCPAEILAWLIGLGGCLGNFPDGCRGALKT